tara:strand:+ start:706 stop:957 length:252 start_codon:yes stop_codon:yes gene_type:complete
MVKENIIYYVVAFFLGMLLVNMLKNVCGCNNIEGLWVEDYETIIPCCGPTQYCNGKLTYDNCNYASGCSWSPTCPVPSPPKIN